MTGSQPAASIAAGRAAGAAMDSVDSHVARILSAARPLPPRRLSLAEADGAVLAEDVWARCPLPCFDNSAMDGYAVVAFDVASATPDAPVTLPVGAEVAAGDVELRQLTAGTCMRIMTGALMPAGADAVVRVEWTNGGTERIAISRPVRAGDSIRRIGSDIRPGELLLAAGTRLGPAQLGLLAAAGRASILARPRPRLTIMSAGNELAEPGEPLIPGRSWESNSFMLAAAGSRAACRPGRRTSRPGIVAVFQDHGHRASCLRDGLVQARDTDAVCAWFPCGHPGGDRPPGHRGGSGDPVNGAVAVAGVVWPWPQRVQGVAQRRVSHPVSDSMPPVSAAVIMAARPCWPAGRGAARRACPGRAGCPARSGGERTP